jgi:hypothetical protein
VKRDWSNKGSKINITRNDEYLSIKRHYDSNIHLKIQRQAGRLHDQIRKLKITSTTKNKRTYGQINTAISSVNRKEFHITKFLEIV